MDPEGRPLTPGISYGPPPSQSAQNSIAPTFLNHILQSSCSPNMRDELMSAKNSGDEGSLQTEDTQPRTDAGRGAQRRFRSSAFPSSLSWDSDSEREILDEEELQHLSNPHGLAAHSPGSPSSGLRLSIEGDQEPEKLQHLHSSKPVEGQRDNNGSTEAEEPNTCQLGPTELADSKVWNVSEGAELFLSKVKPKEGCQMEEEADNSDGEKRQKGKESKERERDVYTFPGDSDPESPPPAPWAHCTFIQRCRRKRVLLRPFSGLGTWKHTLPETGRRARVGPQKTTTEPAQLCGDGGVYDFEEVNFGERTVEYPAKFEEENVEDQERSKEESGVEPGKDIFTCVECSIYFKKQVHLQEHMIEHCQSDSRGGRRDRVVKSGRFRCAECGWNLSNRLALVDHHRKHQESRLKILEEIEKLNDNEKAEEMQNLDSEVMEHTSPNPAVVQEVGPASCPGKVSDSEIAMSPTMSPIPISTLDANPVVVLDSDPALMSPDLARTPARARAVPANRRRFVCSKCNFSTRTSQAMANHVKAHSRKNLALQHSSPCLQPKCPAAGADSLPPSPPSCLTSTSLACGHCAFLTSSQTLLREHQKLVHPGQISGTLADEMGQHSRSSLDALISNPILHSDHLSGSGASSLVRAPESKITATEDSTTSDSAAVEPLLECIGSRRFSRRGKDWTDLANFHLRLDDKLRGREDKQDDDQSSEIEVELTQKETDSVIRLKPHTIARSDTDECSTQQTKSPKETNEKEMENDKKVFFLRRSARVIAASAENANDDNDNDDDEDDDYDDDDEEYMRHFLSENVLDEDKDEIDEVTDVLKSVERKCPYCPDRFHNGIGLANHVRGHLNRVGVSYNVRHFISPEEVNAIERKFSYQKKKKKVANFDPDTFSVMHCEFCSAGFDTRAGLSSHARAHLRDFGITNWDVTISPIHILRELFSRRPDLVIPTAPPRSPGSQHVEGEEEEEKETDEEGEEIIEVKLEGESDERTSIGTASDELPSASHQPWNNEDSVGMCEGEEEGAAEEEEEEEEQLRIQALDDLRSSPEKTGLFSVNQDSRSPGKDADTKDHHLKCEVCGAQFETRRGLSTHARSHLRQRGIDVSESTGSPINHLYQIAKKRSLDGKISPNLHALPSANQLSPSVPSKDELEDMDLDKKPIPLSILAKAPITVPPSSSSTPSPSPRASPGPAHSASPSSVVRKAPISSLLPVSSPLRSPELKAGGLKNLTSNLSGPATMTAKPLWAPQETDAPLNLTLEVDPNKDIICQLCGAWFETRKGLSSHARAHLRHFGVEYSESKGSPIDLLNQLIDTDDFKHKASALQLDSHAEMQGLTTSLSSPKQPLLTLSSSSSSSLLYKVTTAGGGSTSKATSSSASSLLGPPAKRPKSSSMQVFRLSSGELMALPHSEPPKEIGCEFCGEYFENRKGLSSHARSHLRQMGITEWSVNGSPIDTLREIITRRGLPCALPQKPLKTPPPSSPGPPRSPLSSSSSPATLLSRLPFAFARPSSPQPAVSKSSSVPPTSSSGLILKLKPEPVQLEVTTPAAVGRSVGFSAEPRNCSWSSSDNVFPLNLAMAHDVEPTRDIRCEFCGEYFENRKGLSSHARSHLRQMGITEWSVNGSPIDTLREVMRKRRVSTSSPSGQGVKKEYSQGANSPPWENTEGQGSSEGLSVLGYQSSKYRKSPLSLLQSGPRLKSVGPSATSSAGRFFRMSPLGKRPLSEEAHSVEANHSSPHQLKTFSPLPHDFSFKRKSSPDKHGAGHQDPSCELCGFYFENRKALASHARAHLRQFGVTEWCVNGSPIETLSAWMRSRPQKVLEMHRSYMQGNRTTLKKKASSSTSSSSSSSQWSSTLAVSLVRPTSREINHEINKGSSKSAEGEAGNNRQTPPIKPGSSSPSPSRPPSGLHPQAQVARSELNVRLPRGFERRPLKHPSCPDGTERESGPPKPPRTGTVPALVPKPPSYPLVKLVGKFYTLKCRFCEMEFHGPLSVQEDWIRHLQQHILKMNYNKTAGPRAAPSEPPAPADGPVPVQASVPASTSTSSTTSTTSSLTSASASDPTHTTAPAAATPTPNSRPSTPPAECAPTVTAKEIVKVSEEQPTITPTPVPLPTQTV